MDEIIEFVIDVVIANICETVAERWPLLGMAFITAGFFVVSPWSFGTNLLVFAGSVVAFIALLNWAQAWLKRRRAAAVD